MNKELDVVSKDMHKNYNGIYLTDNEVAILNSNGINIGNYTSLKELMFDIEDILNDTPNDELENVLVNLSEFNYYHNTNK